jgi:hypothetical protein
LRASAPVAIIAADDASMAAKAMMGTDDVSGVSSQRSTEPVAIVDAPNAASSRLICRACRRSALANDSGVMGV